MTESAHTPTTVPRVGLEKSSLNAPVEKPVTMILNGEEVARGIKTNTCPQCGLNPVNKVHNHKFQFIPPWIYLGLLANVLAFLVLYHFGRREIKSEIGLCDACKAQMTRAQFLRIVSTISAIIGPALIGGLAGSAFGIDVGLLVGGAAFVAGVVGSVVTFKRTKNHLLTVKKIEKYKLKGAGGRNIVYRVLKLEANPQFRATLLKEAPYLFNDKDLDELK